MHEKKKEGWSEKWNDPCEGNPRLTPPKPKTAGRALRASQHSEHRLKSRLQKLKNAQSAMKRQSDLSPHIFNNHHALNGIEDSWPSQTLVCLFLVFFLTQGEMFKISVLTPGL